MMNKRPMCLHWTLILKQCKPQYMINRKTKQFKIGEYAMGGIIRVDVTKESPDYKLVEVKALDWNTKNVLMADWAETDNGNWRRNIDNTLNEMTTSYYSAMILNWIDNAVAKA